MIRISHAHCGGLAGWWRNRPNYSSDMNYKNLVMPSGMPAEESDQYTICHKCGSRVFFENMTWDGKMVMVLNSRNDWIGLREYHHEDCTVLVADTTDKSIYPIVVVRKGGTGKHGYIDDDISIK